jgi:UDP-glucose 4-epimerase
MKITLFGGAGFLGAQIARSLLCQGHEVRIFDKPGAKSNPHAFGLEDAVWLEGDFANSLDVQNAVVGSDIILHLISSTIPKQSSEDLSYDLVSNAVPTLQLLDCARDAGVKKLLYFSSGGTVYGQPQYLPIDENHPTNPLVPYGITKLAIEKYCLLYEKFYGLKTHIMRVSNPYGPTQLVNQAQGAVGVFLSRILNNQPIEIWGDGTVIRDYLYIDDLTRAVNHLIDYQGSESVFNIGSGVGLSLNEIILFIESALDKKADCHYHESRSFDVPINILSIERAQQELGWSPEHSFASGLQKTLARVLG